MLYSANKKETFLERYWLFFFYILTISYLELVYRVWNFRSLNTDFVYPVVFSVTAAAIMYLLSSAFSEKVNKIMGYVLLVLLIIAYGVQLFYFCIFHTPLSFYSLSGAEDALKFTDVVFTSLFHNAAAILLLLLPLAALILVSRKMKFTRIRRPTLYKALLILITSQAVAFMSVNLNKDAVLSQHALYYNVSAPELSVTKLGLMTTMRLDIERLAFGFEQTDPEDSEDPTDNDPSTSTSTSPNSQTKSPLASTSPSMDQVPAPYESQDTTPQAVGFDNIMNIDFNTLIANEKNPDLLTMHKYFASVTPTKKNSYTGMFKGNNLILITAEAFSPYAISKELTPTLYMMQNEGFVFKNFYNPVWGVSTSDGEYVACTGLIPKSGIWSFAKSGSNYMPFVMGNQFKRLGYMTKAYHDHTYTYYKRNISHPNMGYTFKAVGNGLKLKKTWPESDVEMINVTAKEYIGKKPFHTYYMSVSGHMNYSFTGNYMAYKNRKYVAKLPYSDPAKAYIAANLEFEFAMKTLIAKLEAANIAENTVIAISPDHYPYGLPKENIDELAGHTVEKNFELYKSCFLLWKKGMKPVVVTKPCASIDINPTLSNLFGLTYDSRLLAGRDILSDASPLVIFSNRSWLTDKCRYNSLTNTTTSTDGSAIDKTYVRKTNRVVANKFRFSARILEADYYGKFILPLMKFNK